MLTVNQCKIVVYSGFCKVISSNFKLIFMCWQYSSDNIYGIYRMQIHIDMLGFKTMQVCSILALAFHHRRIIEGPLTPFSAKLCCCFRSALTGRHRKKLPAEKAWRHVEVNNFGFICFLIIIHLVRNLQVI